MVAQGHKKETSMNMF